jgi:hypothetical protein
VYVPTIDDNVQSGTQHNDTDNSSKDISRSGFGSVDTSVVNLYQWPVSGNKTEECRDY